MNAFITGGFNCGLGSTYDSIYRFYNTQEFLKKLGYSVKIYVDFSINHYRTHNNDREFIKKIFNFDLFDNINLLTSGFNPHQENFEERKNCELILNNNRIFYVYVDKKINGLEKIEDFTDWQFRDDLPKINMFSNEIISFCEKRMKLFDKEVVTIHFRPFEYEDHSKILKNCEEEIRSIILKNNDKIVCLITPFEMVKEYFKNEKFSNLYINDYNFTKFFEISVLKLDDVKLNEYLKEICFEMFLSSFSKKIYRVGCTWFSNFLFFSCTYNQTNFSNKIRFIPPFK